MRRSAAYRAYVMVTRYYYVYHAPARCHLMISATFLPPVAAIALFVAPLPRLWCLMPRCAHAYRVIAVDTRAARRAISCRALLVAPTRHLSLHVDSLFMLPEASHVSLPCVADLAKYAPRVARAAGVAARESRVLARDAVPRTAGHACYRR